MTTARYLLCPGMVRSRADGDEHFVGARQLMRLYGLRPEQCLVMPEARPGQPCGLRRWLDGALERGDLIALRPRADGDYRLPPVPPMGVAK